MLNFLAVPFNILLVFPHIFFQTLNPTFQVHISPPVTRGLKRPVVLYVVRIPITINVTRVSMIRKIFIEKVMHVWLCVKRCVYRTFGVKNLLLVFGESSIRSIFFRKTFWERLVQIKVRTDRLNSLHFRRIYAKFRGRDDILLVGDAC